jgi:hypothetical protein
MLEASRCCPGRRGDRNLHAAGGSCGGTRGGVFVRWTELRISICSLKCHERQVSLPAALATHFPMLVPSSNQPCSFGRAWMQMRKLLKKPCSIEPSAIGPPGKVSIVRRWKWESRPWSEPRLGTHTWLVKTNNESNNEPTLRFSTSGISY